MSNVFIGIPCYSQSVSWGTARSVFTRATRVHRVDIVQASASLITLNCNSLWCAALNGRKSHALDWFAMLHTDVEPSEWWIDSLIAEAEKHGADLMSAVIPLKNRSGGTSTAIAHADSRFGQFCRLTQSQILHPDFPKTFGINEAVDALAALPEPMRITGAPRTALLANTGCFVCRLTAPWAEQVWFDQMDAIECRNGVWGPLCASEDWNFSRRVADAGGKVMATTTVRAIHRGEFPFSSGDRWGEPRDLNQMPDMRL
jgi:hypothetical protein